MGKNLKFSLNFENMTNAHQEFVLNGNVCALNALTYLRHSRILISVLQCWSQQKDGEKIANKFTDSTKWYF